MVQCELLCLRKEVAKVLVSRIHAAGTMIRAMDLMIGLAFPFREHPSLFSSLHRKTIKNEVADLITETAKNTVKHGLSEHLAYKTEPCSDGMIP